MLCLVKATWARLKSTTPGQPGPWGVRVEAQQYALLELLVGQELDVQSYLYDSWDRVEQGVCPEARLQRVRVTRVVRKLRQRDGNRWARAIPLPVAFCEVEKLFVQEAPAPAVQEDMATTFSKLQNGNWGVRVKGKGATRVMRGDKLTVSKKDGSTKLVTVERVLWAGNDTAICAIAAEPKAPKSEPRRVPEPVCRHEECLTPGRCDWLDGAAESLALAAALREDCDCGSGCEHCHERLYG